MAVPCHAFYGESCILAFGVRSAQTLKSVNIIRVTWRAHSENGDIIVTYNERGDSQIRYKARYAGGHFTLNSTDGSLTINGISQNDGIDFCFSFCCSTYGCPNTECVRPVIQGKWLGGEAYFLLKEIAVMKGLKRNISSQHTHLIQKH